MNREYSQVIYLAIGIAIAISFVTILNDGGFVE